MRRAVLCLALAAVMVTGCGSDDETTSSGGSTTEPGDTGNTEPAAVSELSAEALDGQTFVAEEATGRELVAGSTLTMTFEDGRLGVNAGCNQMSGAYEVDGTTLAWIDAPIATMMACEPDLMAQDEWIAAVLTDGVEASLAGSELTLSSGDVTVVLVAQATTAQDLPLVGTAWTLDTLIDGDTASSVPSGLAPPTLSIAEDGTAEIFAGCNRGNATVEVADDEASMVFGPVALTRRLCPDGGSDLESAVLAVLDGEVQASVDDGRLTLTKGDLGLVYAGS